jgi:predicted RNA-binding Zn-ribbon protein involved in translation (DUF1610 family)
MPKFNNGNPYHGSDQVSNGRLLGATGETDYFYFFCPKCSDHEIMRILEYGEHGKDDFNEHNDAVNEYNKQCKSKAKYGFILVFKLYCENCGHSDFVKISNTGWQGGKHSGIVKK